MVSESIGIHYYSFFFVKKASIFKSPGQILLHDTKVLKLTVIRCQSIYLCFNLKESAILQREVHMHVNRVQATLDSL